MPATIGATVSSPNAGSVQKTSGNSSRTGRRRARRSAARCRMTLASSASRRSVSFNGAPVRTWSVSARRSGRAASPQSAPRPSSATATGTPRSIDVAAEASPGRACGGDHRARTGSAAGTVSPAPSASCSRSTTSGRSSSIGPPWSAFDRRSRRHRRASSHAPCAPSAGTTPIRRHPARTRVHRPARSSRCGCGALPAVVRRMRPTPVTGCDRRAGRATPSRPEALDGSAAGPIASSTAVAAHTDTTTAVTSRSGPGGASTAPRRRRASRRRRCTPNPPASAGGRRQTPGRRWRAGR